MKTLSVFLIISLLCIVSCSKDNNDLQEEFTPEYIAQMHNIYLDRLMNDFNPINTRNENTVYSVLFMEAIDYLVTQPDLGAIPEVTIIEIKEFIRNFEIDDNLDKSFNEQFLEYLFKDINSKLKLELTYEDFVSMAYGTRSASVIVSEKHENAFQVFSETYKASSEFWSDYYPITRADGGVYLADAGGALWGLALGGVGSIIAGAICSYAADCMAEGSSERGGGFDGKVHTPKDI